MTAPANTLAPVLSGTPLLGATLTVTSGTWTGAVSYAYAWLRNGVVIAGETSTTHIVTRSDLGATISARVTATSSDPLSASEDSNSLAEVPGTLIVEDGSAKVDAESFCTVAFADDYHDKRGNAAWAAKGLGAKEAALRVATDYMEQVYRLQWDGYRYTLTQALSWPRWEVRRPDALYGYRMWASYIGFDTVPDLIKMACSDLALRALTAPLIKDIGPLKSRVKVGPIETEYVVSSLDKQVQYASVNSWLAPFMGSHGPYTARVTRS